MRWQSAGKVSDGNLPRPQELIRRYGLGARRGLGQHFLLDPGIADRIARAAGTLEGRTAVEIGPGPGGLTRALLQAGAERIVAVERDARCVEALAELAAASGGRLRVMAADALDVDVAALGPAPIKLIANLPYNVATPLLVGWLRRSAGIESMTLMFQKEVADRLVAPPGSKARGRLSILVQWRAEVRRCFDLPPGAFTPAPKVASSVVALTPRSAPVPAIVSDLEQITARAFGGRRKMLRRTLGDLPARAGLDDTLRPEELTVDDFCALARALRGERPE